jgi:hypothetical protein
MRFREQTYLCRKGKTGGVMGRICQKSVQSHSRTDDSSLLHICELDFLSECIRMFSFPRHFN